MAIKNQIELSQDPTTRAKTVEVDDVIKRLQAAYEDGRLNEVEFEERMSSAVRAKTQNELANLVFVPPLTCPRLLLDAPVIHIHGVAILGGVEIKA